MARLEATPGSPPGASAPREANTPIAWEDLTTEQFGHAREVYDFTKVRPQLFSDGSPPEARGYFRGVFTYTGRDGKQSTFTVTGGELMIVLRGGLQRCRLDHQG